MSHLRTVNCSNHIALVTDGRVRTERLSNESDMEITVPVPLCLQQI
jgi:hypothetical protein